MERAETNPLNFLQGGGTTGDLIAAIDWDASSIGNPGSWPQPLQSSLSLLLHSRFPMFIWWGDDMIMFYNDAYLPIAGEKHPQAMGGKGAEIWAEVWDEVGPMVERVKATKQPTWAEDQRLDIKRHGILEEAYFTFSHSPILTESGAVGGIFCVVSETTEKVYAIRKVQDSERNLRNMILQSPVAMCILRGPDFIIDVANDAMIQLWGKSKESVMQKPVFEALPDAKNQGLEQVMLTVYQTGVPFYANERPVVLLRNGKEEAVYQNFVYQPYRGADGTTLGVLAISVDVSSQVLARKKIEESNEELQQALQIADLGAFRIDVLANTATYSDRIMDWFGFTEQGLRMDIIAGFVHPDDRSRFMEALVSSYAGEATSRHDVTYRVVHPRDGVTRHLRSHGKTLFTSEGQPYLIVGVIQDVTSQLAYQAQLQASEADLQRRVAERTSALEEQKKFIGSILDASFDGIYALKAIRGADGAIKDFTYLFANENIAKLLHLNVQEIIGSSMLSLIPENRTNGFFDLFCTLLKTGERLRGETHFVTADINRWYDYVIVPIDSETVVTTTEDITEKKRAALQLEEQRNLLDNILKNSSNGITVGRFLRNENGNVVDALTILANDAAVRYSGFPKEIYLSKKATEIEPDILHSPYFQACIQTLETGEPFVTQYKTQSTERWLEVTVSRLDHDHLIHVFTDVTPIKETQLQLERYVEELKRSNQNLEEFAYAASHDLKEPVRKIQLFSDRLRQRLQATLSAEDKNLFDRILYAALRMDTLVDDLLTYSHVSKGAMLDESIDLNKKVSLVLEDLDLEVERKHAAITVDPLPVIKGHRRQLQQLFQNLIGNAIKYHKPGQPPQVHIQAQKVHGSDFAPLLPAEGVSKDYYLIAVRDNGIGFETADAERIFNVFTRLHGNAEYKGTGVGLSIARKVVENHGGAIWAEGQPGEGSVFKILLPAE